MNIPKGHGLFGGVVIEHVLILNSLNFFVNLPKFCLNFSNLRVRKSVNQVVVEFIGKIVFILNFRIKLCPGSHNDLLMKLTVGEAAKGSVNDVWILLNVFVFVALE